MLHVKLLLLFQKTRHHHTNRGIMRAYLFCICVLLASCSKVSDSAPRGVRRLEAEMLKKYIGLDPSLMYVVKASVSPYQIDVGFKDELSYYLVKITSVDGVLLEQPMEFLADNLPRGVSAGESLEFFARILLRQSGLTKPSVYTAKIPFPAFDTITSTPGVYSLDVFIELLGVVNRNPFNGGPPPETEIWTLPDDYIQRLKKVELEEQHK